MSLLVVMDVCNGNRGYNDNNNIIDFINLCNMISVNVVQIDNLKDGYKKYDIIYISDGNNYERSLYMQNVCKFMFRMADGDEKTKIEHTKNIFVSDNYISIYEFIKHIAINGNDCELGNLYISQGFVYYDGDKIFRKCMKSSIEDYKMIIGQSLDKYVGNFLPKILSYKDTVHSVDFEVEKIKHITRYTEWTSQQKLDAFKFVLDFIIKLYEDGFTLKDPHFFNVTYRFGNPVYLDIGSVQKCDIIFGSIAAFNTLCSDIFIWFSIFDNVNENIGKQIEDIKKSINKDNFIENMVVIRSIIDGIPVIDSSHPTWSKYCTVIPKTITEYENISLSNFKVAVPLQVGIELAGQCKTVVDVGCNTGYFSFMLAMLGYDVIGFDSIADTINIAQKIAKQKKSTTTFCLLDLLNIPTNVGFAGRAGHVFDRLRSDLCLVAAVTHHLSRVGTSFDKQAEMFSKLTNKHLLVEFIPSEDIHVNAWKLPKEYNINNFRQALIKVGFNIVWIKNSSPTPRKWIYAIR